MLLFYTLKFLRGFFNLKKWNLGNNLLYSRGNGINSLDNHNGKEYENNVYICISELFC